MENTNNPTLCYSCQYRQDSPGSCHSSCNHPCFSGANMLKAVLMGLSGDRLEGQIEVIGNPHGVSKGWFMHPLNFDPIWLKSCSGFLKK